MARPRTAALSDEQIVANYRRGDYSRTRLARLAQVSRTRIDRVLAEAGFDLVPQHLDPEVQRGILAAYATGVSIPEVAQRWRVAVATATLVILRAGELRKPGRRPGRLRLHPGLDVLELHAAGGAQLIADVAGVSPTTAYRLVREARAQQRNQAPVIVTAEVPCEVHAGHETADGDL